MGRYLMVQQHDESRVRQGGPILFLSQKLKLKQKTGKKKTKLLGWFPDWNRKS
jgi:hypothetical protein